MHDLLLIISCTTLAGLCMPAGGALARIKGFQRDWLEDEFRHFVIALGGGILVGAVAVVLVPEGLAHMDHSYWAIPAFLAGGFVFLAVEWLMARRKHQAPQLLGMLLDFLPESLALGGMLALGGSAGPLLAALIGLQNLPEGFNAYRELDQLTRHGPRKVLLTMLALVPLGPVFGVVGYLTLSDHPWLLGMILLFASGGILYLIFQDIAPQSRLKHHWSPSLGAVLGFCLAMLGTLITGG